MRREPGPARPRIRLVGRQIRIEIQLQHVERLVEALEGHLTAVDVGDLVGSPSEMYDAVGHEHLTALRDRTQPRGEVEGASAVAARDRNRLAGIDSNANAKRQRGIGAHLLPATALQVNRGTKRRPRRPEYAQRLVAAKLHHLATMALDLLAHHLGESRSEASSSLVAVSLRESCVSAHIGDQERADLGWSICAVGHYHAIVRSWAGPRPAASGVQQIGPGCPGPRPQERTRRR